MLIAFSGLDGTGKTTQAVSLMEYLRGKGIECRYRHAIKDTLYYFIVHKIVGKASGGAKSGLEKGLRSPERGLPFAFLSAVKRSFLLLDVLYFNLRYRSYRHRTDRALICDRYFFDEMVQARYLGIAGDAFLNAYGRLIPEPDMVFISDTAPETASGRKNENYSREYFAEKARLYGDLLRKDSLIRLPDMSEEEVKEAVVNACEGVFGK